MSTQKAEQAVSKLPNSRQLSVSTRIHEVEVLTIPDACCNHIRDCQTRALLFRVIHPCILGLARRIRDGGPGKNVWVNGPRLTERQDYGYEESEDARGHVHSDFARIE